MSLHHFEYRRDFRDQFYFPRLLQHRFCLLHRSGEGRVAYS